MKWIVPFVDFNKQFNTFKKKYIADFSKVMSGGDFTLRNDVKILVEIKTSEYIKNGTGMKSMNKTAKNTPTAYDLF